MIDFSPIILTLELAVISTIILFIVALPVAYWAAFTKSKVKPIVETIISLPIVLPPTVIGFYLLVVLAQTIFLASFFKILLVFN